MLDRRWAFARPRTLGAPRPIDKKIFENKAALVSVERASAAAACEVIAGFHCVGLDADKCVFGATGRTLEAGGRRHAAPPVFGVVDASRLRAWRRLSAAMTIWNSPGSQNSHAAESFRAGVQNKCSSRRRALRDRRRLLPMA
jgi:hypothetical protein